jgi:small ligand-binding sensory domain FIST
MITTTARLVRNPLNALIAMHNIAHGGMRYSFSIRDGNLSAADLNILFHELKRVEDGQTITIVGNPGALTCDVTIAEAKGWTVIKEDI